MLIRSPSPVFSRFMVPQQRLIHATRRQDSMTPLIVGGSVAVMAYGGKVVLEAIDRRFNSAPKPEEGTDKETQKSNFFTDFFSFGKKFYEGGFEPEMTRREAALILGIRESATRKKVKEAHRRLAMINHPDTGGSTHVATKINEAKDKLLGLGTNN